MPVETTEKQDVNREKEAGRIETRSPGVSIEHETKSAQTIPPPDRQSTRRRRSLVGVLGALILLAACVLGIPWIREMLNTVSTDDAYVNGHVTFVAPRVGGQIARVLVDDNYRVQKGELLAELDKEPYQIAVSQKRAAVDTAEADLQAATAMVRGIEAEARSRRWKLQRAVEDLDNQIALLHARIAALDKSKATLALAQVDFNRAKQLLGTPAESRQQYDRAQRTLSTADAQVNEALAEVYQARASLGLPAQPSNGEDLGQVPPDLDETFSSVLAAQADLIQSAAQLGVVHSYAQSPKQMLDEFEKQGDIDRYFAQLTTEAPAVKQAAAKLETANRHLAQAELDLRYCDIVAKIDGVVTRRNVNPGDYVQIGQNLMAIRSLVTQRAELRKQPFHFDSIGLSLLVIVMVSWEVMLSKGQEWDWLGDPFWRVQTLAIFFTVGLVGLIFWELRHRNPVVNFRPLGERNFAACCIIIFCAYLVLYAASTSLPGLLQSLFGYDALSAGLVMSPGGIFAVLAMPIVGRLLGRGTDARWLIAAGLLIMTVGNYWMSQLNLDISPGQVIWPRVLVVAGLAVCFAPANVAAYLYTPMALRGAAVGLLSLLRNEGGSVGTSLAQTFQERRDQFHTLRLGEYLDPFNSAAKSFLTHTQAFFLQQTADPVALQQLAWQQLENVRQQQASALAYFDIFWMIALLTFAVAFLVLFMKRSVAERGAHMAQSE